MANFRVKCSKVISKTQWKNDAILMTKASTDDAFIKPFCQKLANVKIALRVKHLKVICKIELNENN